MTLEKQIIENYTSRKELLADILTDKDISLDGDETFSELVESIEVLLPTYDSPYFKGNYSKTVSISWNDDSNSKGIRPSSVIMFLCYNNIRIGVCELKQANSWSYTFTGLTYNTNYTVETVNLDGYTKTTNGLTVTYALTTYSLTVALNINGLPEGVDYSRVNTVLMGEDESCPVTIRVSQYASNSFRYTFTNLIKGTYGIKVGNYGVEDFYLDNNSKVAEALVLNQNTTVNLYLSYSEIAEEEEEFVDIPVTISWSGDNNNADSNRPSTVTVRLYADGAEVDSKIATSVNGWTADFTELPMYDGGNEIYYSVNIDSVPNYISSIDEFNITLTYSVEVTGKTVRVVWNDNANATGIRPSSLGVVLYRNGTAYQTIVLNENNGWSSTVAVPVVVNQQPATYSWIAQTAIGYNEPSIETEGSITTITFDMWVRPTDPTNPKPRPK